VRMPVCYWECCRSEKGVAAHASTALASAGRTHARRTGGNEPHQKGEAVRLLAHPPPRAVYQTVPRRTERDLPRQLAGPTSHTAAARLALATILQAYTGVSDDEAIEASMMNRRWQLVLDCLDADEPPFSKGTLVRTFVGC
jgi:hypothetical protein